MDNTLLASKEPYRKSSSGILCRVVVVRTDVSEERIASIFRAGESRRGYSEQVAFAHQRLIFWHGMIFILKTSPQLFVYIISQETVPVTLVIKMIF
jgi:hypothetical protein